MADNLDQRFPRYSKLLALYPSGYRREYGEQMLQTLADMLDDPERSHVTIWLCTVVDFPLSVIRQQITYTGEVMANTTPAYIKRNALLGAWLVAPFFVFIILNSLMNQRLHDSWVWHTKALFIWLVVLPGLAVIFNLAALLRWVQVRRQTTHSSVWRTLADFRRNWPAVGMVLVGLAILAVVFLHDSTHCVTGNPIRELRNPSMTWHCIQQG